MLRVVVDSRLRFDASEIDPSALSVLLAGFEHHNPQHEKLKRINQWAAKKEPPIIKTWCRGGSSDGDISLPRGGARLLGEWAARFGVPFEFVDRRQHGFTCDGFKQLVPLWEHQRRLVDAVIERENCVARAPTGSGKTSAAIAAICELGCSSLVVVYDGALLQQWKRRLVAELGIAEHEIGIVGGGKFKPASITIAMQQTLNRLPHEQWRDLDSYFGCVVCDEVQRFSSVTYQRTIDRSSARYRIGISANERRKDGKEFLIYDQFGDVAIDISPRELVARRLVLDVEVVVLPTRFDAPWYVAQRRDQNSMPDFTRLIAEMVGDADRNRIATDAALECVRAGHQTVLFSHRREHCRALNSVAASEGIKSGLLLGSAENAAEFEDVVRRLNDRSLMWASGTLSAIGQGLDIPAVSRGVVVTPIASNRSFWGQVCGRLCRIAERKSDARLYYLWDEQVFGLAPLRNLVRWNDNVQVLVDGKLVDARAVIERKARDETQRSDRGFDFAGSSEWGER